MITSIIGYLCYLVQCSHWFYSLLTGTFFVCGTYQLKRKVRKGCARDAKSIYVLIHCEPCVKSLRLCVERNIAQESLLKKRYVNNRTGQ